MITERIKALFNFIEYLHSNIENFKQYDKDIEELTILDVNRKKLSPRINFAEKMKYDDIQDVLKHQFDIIDMNIIQPIKDKSIELNICEWGCNETLYNWNISEVTNLKGNFSKDDVPEIVLYKIKYIEFRTKTNCDYFQTFFFKDLDELLKALFDYFKETEVNEFEVFEKKTILFQNIIELPEKLNKGDKKERETPKTLISMISHTKSIEIVESIKVQYKNIKGKRLKLLLLSLQHLELLPKERISTEFHDCCKNEFEWKIASYNAMNGYKFNEEIDSIEFANMKQHLEKLIKSN